MNALVFITGATGFIGSQVALATLEAGYRVRLCVRKPDQKQLLEERYSRFASKVEVALLPDITNTSAFIGLLNGVDYVFHLASPMPGKGSDFQADYVRPAVEATQAILHAALRYPQIQKVIIMSSVLALLPPTAAGSPSVSVKGERSIFSGKERDHRLTQHFPDNTGEVIPIELDMSFPEGFMGEGVKYSASKVLAHQATRDFLKQFKPQYTLLTFHPTFVLGDSLIQESAKDIDGMNAFFWSSLFSEKPGLKNAWVHVRDVAEAHVKALRVSIETGTEFILSAPPVSWDQAVELIKRDYPQVGCKIQSPVEGGWNVDTSSADRLLMINWRSMETIIKDVLDQQLGFEERE
ncbi:uncharacterized protein N7511_005242 [Penicillium nucicola]|uniref:uncharacterized protein n=1 Tax=Penicillium nucicola TaxID=1850975 RepID=UPI0025456A09|nr:uncharacterized protein N7511_005242 [Penicillium nucicola]KAJ5761860.1 hypothetical protein N7511_005242 [Penicillium nucicola]